MVIVDSRMTVFINILVKPDSDDVQEGAEEAVKIISEDSRFWQLYFWPWSKARLRPGHFLFLINLVR